jgi:hypothetical protein
MGSRRISYVIVAALAVAAAVALLFASPALRPASAAARSAAARATAPSRRVVPLEAPMTVPLESASSESADPEAPPRAAPRSTEPPGSLVARRSRGERRSRAGARTAPPSTGEEAAPVIARETPRRGPIVEASYSPEPEFHASALMPKPIASASMAAPSPAPAWRVSRAAAREGASLDDTWAVQPSSQRFVGMTAATPPAPSASSFGVVGQVDLAKAFGKL